MILLILELCIDLFFYTCYIKIRRYNQGFLENKRRIVFLKRLLTCELSYVKLIKSLVAMEEK